MEKKRKRKEGLVSVWIRVHGLLEKVLPGYRNAYPFCEVWKSSSVIQMETRKF